VETRSPQLFLNNNCRVTYSIVRHHQGKGKYTYCKLEKQDLETLKSQSLQLPSVLDRGQSFKSQHHKNGQAESSSNSKNKWAGSSARIEHHPPKPSKNNYPQIDWIKYREFLLSKFSRSYALQVFNNGLRHYYCLENPTNISAIPATTRGNVLKAMVNLSKFLGCYEEYKLKLRNNGVKWINTDDSFNSFLRIINNNHNNLGEWYRATQNILRDKEKLWLKFTLETGLRKQEAINSFNLIIQLAGRGKLSEYYNEELGILEHFKYGDLFLRATKKVYISIVSEELVSEIASSQPVSYSAIRKRLARNKQKLRFKELRSYFATYLRKKGILAEYVDLLQGRIPKSVFARHYLKVEDVKELVKHVLTVTDNLIETLEPREA
jgi:hypothetical protein